MSVIRRASATLAKKLSPSRSAVAKRCGSKMAIARIWAFTRIAAVGDVGARGTRSRFGKTDCTAVWISL